MFQILRQKGQSYNQNQHLKMLTKKISLSRSAHTEEDSDFFVREAPSPKPEGKKFRKWTENENFSYAKFLLENFQQFSCGNQRRSMNFFKKMSQAVDNDRSNEQCRSHHQKMLKRFGTVEEIIRNLRQPEASKQEKPELQKTSSTFEEECKVMAEDFNEDLKSFHPINTDLELIMVEDAPAYKQESFMNFFEAESLGYFF